MSQPFHRRDLLRSAAVAAVAGCLPGRGFAQAAPPALGSVKLGRGARGPVVPDDFVGLSYEVEQLEDPRFFSPSNQPLIETFRDLSQNGVLRLGGNTSEFSWWQTAPDQAPPARSAGRTRAGEPPASTLYAVTPAAIDELAGFLHATGWSCIYGLNLGNGHPADLAREAAYVATRLGERLHAFTIGNEPDLFGRHLRDPAHWTVDAYLDEWLAAARAVQSVAPNAAFIMPEVANATDWLTTIAARWPAIPHQPRLKALSHHYYFGGPPANPNVNINRLLQPDPRVRAEGEIARTAAQRIGVRYRVTEANSCYHGGKPGVSDVLASALWAADYFLELMSLGYAGAHLHGGSGHAVATSVGGRLEGEAFLPDAAPRPRPFYTPIATIGGRIEPQPVYYGMKFAGLFAGSTILPVELQAGGVNATAYAVRRPDGAILLSVINKDLTRELALDIGPHRPLAELTGPGPASRSADLTLSEAERPAVEGPVVIPRASAALVRIGHII